MAITELSNKRPSIGRPFFACYLWTVRRWPGLLAEPTGSVPFHLNPTDVYASTKYLIGPCPPLSYSRIVTKSRSEGSTDLS